MRYYVYHGIIHGMTGDLEFLNGHPADFAHVIRTEQKLKDSPYLTEFMNEDEAWEYAEGLSVSAITDDIPQELWEEMGIEL